MNVLDNKYQVEQLLGQGGMGAVYRATHLGVWFLTMAVSLLFAYFFVSAATVLVVVNESRWTNTHTQTSNR